MPSATNVSRAIGCQDGSGSGHVHPLPELAVMTSTSGLFRRRRSVVRFGTGPGIRFSPLAKLYNLYTLVRASNASWLGNPYRTGDDRSFYEAAQNIYVPRSCLPYHPCNPKASKSPTEYNNRRYYCRSAKRRARCRTNKIPSITVYCNRWQWNDHILKSNDASQVDRPYIK